MQRLGCPEAGWASRKGQVHDAETRQLARVPHERSPITCRSRGSRWRCWAGMRRGIGGMTDCPLAYAAPSRPTAGKVRCGKWHGCRHAALPLFRVPMKGGAAYAQPQRTPRAWASPNIKTAPPHLGCAAGQRWLHTAGARHPGCPAVCSGCLRASGRMGANVQWAGMG